MVSKFSVIFILFSVSFLGANGQKTESNTSELNLIDSLLDKDELDQARILLNQISNEITDNTSRPSRIFYHKLNGDYYLIKNQYQEAANAYEPILDLSRSDLNENECIKMARAINDLGIAYMKLSRFEAAKRMHHLSLELYDRFQDYQGASFNFNNLALIYQESKQIDSALYFYQKSLENARLAGDSLGVGYNLLNKAILLHDNKEPIESLRNFQGALAIFIAQDHEHMINTTKRILARHYIRIKDFEEALRLLRETLGYYQNKESKAGLAEVYEGLGSAFLKLDRYDSALHYLNKSLDNYLPTNYAKGLASVYNLFGSYFSQTGDYQTAIDYFEKSQGLTNNNLKGITMSNLSGLAEIYLNRGEYRLSIATINRALAEANNSASVNSLVKCYEVLYESHKKLGQTSQALNYFELATNLKSELYNEEQAMEMARIEYQNDLEQQEALRKSIQQKKDLIQAQTLKQQRWALYIALIVSVLLAIIALLYYRSYRLKKNANALLEEKNLKLEDLRAKEKELSEETIASKARELAASAMAAHEKNSLLETLEHKINSLEKENTNLKPALKEVKKTIADAYALDKSWDSFLHRFEDVHPGFFDKLKIKHPKLTINDLKLSAYLKVGMSNKEIANVTHLTLGSVKSKINRLKKKLDMNAEDNVRDYLM